MTLAYASFIGMTAGFTQYLFYHGKDRVGFNHRILNMAILPFCVITKDQVIDSLKMLITTFMPDYLNEILEIFAFKINHLDTLQDEYFVEDDNKMKKYGEPDYNYIKLTGDSTDDIGRSISNLFEDLTLSPDDITALLQDLRSHYIDHYEYRKINNPIYNKLNNQYKLIIIYDENTGEPVETSRRPVVLYPKNNNNRKCTTAISIQYLKNKFPERLHDGVIESLKESKIRRKEEEEKRKEAEEKKRKEAEGKNGTEPIMEIDHDLFAPKQPKGEITRKSSSTKPNDESKEQPEEEDKLPYINDKKIKECFEYGIEDSLVKALKEYYNNRYLEVIGLDENDELNLKHLMILILPKDFYIQNNLVISF